MTGQCDGSVPVEIAAIELIRAKLREGFHFDDEIRDYAMESLEENYPDVDVAPAVEVGLASASAMHRAEMATWPAVTDCDRLDVAFRQLDASGIVSRQHFTCCQTCGHAEIGDEIDAADDPSTVRGYTFYHWQDTERAAEGEGIYLCFGTVGEEVDAESIATEVCSVIRANGLDVSWNGSAGTRPLVRLDWKRRKASA